MIPKIIHYSWVGTPIPEVVKQRVDGWKKMLPDWEFKLWNEDNYNFKKFKFTHSKLENHEWGYASDELRYDVVNKYGGFYLDTDMVINKSLEPFLKDKMVWGFMYDNNLLTSFFGSEPNQPLLSLLLAEYSNNDNWNDLQKMTSNPFVTNIFKKNFSNFRLDNSYQELTSGIKIYPRDYFCFKSHNKKANYLQHLFDNSWGNGKKGMKGLIKGSIYKATPILYGEIANYRGVKYSKRFL